MLAKKGEIGQITQKRLRPVNAGGVPFATVFHAWTADTTSGGLPFTPPGAPGVKHALRSIKYLKVSIA
ncbi:MAG: hypothetical protein AVDCRST_MAG56-5018 [uncultured Cytophagales bacterium]|uniref:Uncharacterized protein n=1 Tax=uncultured Cytophagales bacterium TaxID=158755 RepID=A0A6J4K569_9SPHI|nr:MAG: hypothetical protein AVDCRST_MAG56-5018 [uncultured Cytophagales bacterium]